MWSVHEQSLDLHFDLRRSTIPNAQAAEPICQSATGVAVLKLVRAPTISFGVPVFEQWPLKRYIISLVVLSTDARGFILVDQITYYCSFVNRRSIGRLSIKLTVTYSLLIIEIFIHPVKTLLQHYGKSLEAFPGVAYPGFRDNRSTLNTKTGF